MKKGKMTIIKLIMITIIPSALCTALYLAVGIYLQNLPSMILFVLLATLTLFPFEIWQLLNANKKEFGKPGLQIAFLNHEKMDWWKVFVYGFMLFGVAGIMTATIGRLENFLLKNLSDHLYSFLPEYFNWNRLDLIRAYPKDTLIFSCVFYTLMNAFILPVIEEIYFRGFLTNQLTRYGILAPIIVAVVFSFYHWWLPFNNLFRICIFAVTAVIAYKKKNIYISMVFHCLCNLYSSISFVIALLH